MKREPVYQGREDLLCQGTILDEKEELKGGIRSSGGGGIKLVDLKEALFIRAESV